MRRSAFKGFSLIEVELAAVIGGLLLIGFIQVDGEIRRSLRLIHHEAMLEVVYRDLQADLAHAVPAALAAATDGYDGEATPIGIAPNRLTLRHATEEGSDFVLEFRPPGASGLPAGRLRASEDAGASFEPLVSLGAREMLAAVGLHYGGWDTPDVPPSETRPFTLDPRVRYRLLRLNTTLDRPDGEMVPGYVQAAWAPRVVDWDWYPQSWAGASVPEPDTGILHPIAVHRSGLPAVGESFSLFAIGPGGGHLGWLSWDGDPATETLRDNLATPSSNFYTNPDDPTGNDHELTYGSWIPATPGRHAGAEDALRALVGREITVAVWETSRGNGSQSAIQVTGFARIRIDQATMPVPTGTFLGLTDDQGRLLPSAAPEATPSPAPTATPTPAPTPSAAPLLDPVVSIALNAPLTVTPNTDLGWLHAGADFAWVAWSGDTSLAALREGLAVPGTASWYMNPDDPFDRTLAAGKPVIGFSAVENGDALAPQLAALVGHDVVVPIFDQVTGDHLHIAGFGRLTLMDYQTQNLKLRAYFRYRSDPEGNPL